MRAPNARGQCWSVLADSEARRRFAFLDFEIGGGGANRHSQPLAGGRPSDIAFGYGPRSECRYRPTDRFLNLLGKGAALTRARSRPRARARGPPLGRRFRWGGAELWGLFGASRSKPLAAGVSGVCALWHFRLGDRALDPWACGRRTRATNAGRCWPTARPAAALLFWTLRSAVAELTATRSRWPEGGLRILPSDMARALNVGIGRLTAS